jgi:O-glycosyl hydrolase
MKSISRRFRRSLFLTLAVMFPLTISAQHSERPEDRSLKSEAKTSSDFGLRTPDFNFKIDGATKYQTIDGFGVNINTAWWYKGKYGDGKVVQPAIDLLVDSLGATIFRAVIEEMDWEAVNDNNNPNDFNWKYYDSIFTTERFQGVWNTLRYLNSKEIKDGLIISFMGAPPASPPGSAPDLKKSWMSGADYSIAPDMEDEFVESIAALLYYMRHTAGIQFKLVSPMNETDVIAMSKNAEHPYGIVEGPDITDAEQYVRIVRKLAEKLDAIGMNDIRFVAPDAAGDRLFGDCLARMVKDPYIMGRLAHWGVHQYGNDAANYLKIVSQADNPEKSYWVTETAGIGNMLGQLNDNAGAYIFWDGFDCVYQHARRNGYGSTPPNDWVFWFGPGEGKPLIEYIESANSWKPRKQFYQFSQIMKFIKPGSVRIGNEGIDSSLVVSAFLNKNGNLVITGRNNNKQECAIAGTFVNLPDLKSLKFIYTDSLHNLLSNNNIIVNDQNFKADIPAKSVFTIIGEAKIKAKPEPDDWYAGDMHVHRNCGNGTSILPENEFVSGMDTNNLAVISVLADMGDGEVKDSKTDLPKVNGADAAQSVPGRTVHWDAEWHFDPAGTTFENKALGGHIVLLGLTEAHTIWDESPYKILEYGRSQNGIVGFCHMQYLKDSIPGTLDCCTPIDFPVEAALGTIDFLAEDVWLNDASVNAYYRLLNCGFRLGWAAGTDFPCNNSQPFGSLLTYVQVKNGPFTYRQWVEGIKNGRTVVTTNGHNEFLDLKVNGNVTPGDEIRLKNKGSLTVEVIWTSVLEQKGRIELVLNGKVVATREGSSSPGKPVILKANVPVLESSWLCARRMDEKGHRSHTAPVYITLKNAPVRASADDARYFIKWIDKTLFNTDPGGPWNKYFTHDLDVVQNRYRQARKVYEKIAIEAANKR